MLHWTKKQARDFVVNYQMINSKDTYDIDHVFERIKTIQMDPLNVVGTNPELVLQARVRGFKKQDLDHKLYKERYLMDGWDKQMSVYQSTYINHFAFVRDKHAKKIEKQVATYFNIQIKDYIDDVLELFKKHGPILSSELDLGLYAKHQQRQVKISSLVIDYLYHKGILGVFDRRGTQKRYDFMENLHKDMTFKNAFESEEDFIEWYLYRRIQTCGLAWSKSKVHFQGYWIDKKTIRQKYILKLLDKKKILELDIDGIEGVFYIPAKALKLDVALSERISFIAPLDNLIWDRDLLKVLFDFDYLWEVYVPKSKRKYGYYVLPILKGSQFIGKIEFNHYRHDTNLDIKSIETNPFYEDIIESDCFRKALCDFALYLGAEKISYKGDFL